MTKKQEEAIKYLRNYKYTNEVKEAIDIVLSILEEKDKQIDLMAKYISEIDVSEDLCKEGACLEDANHCKVCIKQYFENKVRQESDKGATGK